MIVLNENQAYAVLKDLGFDQERWTPEEYLINEGISYECGYYDGKFQYRFGGDTEHYIAESCVNVGIKPYADQGILNESSDDDNPIKAKLKAIMAARAAKKPSVAK